MRPEWNYLGWLLAGLACLPAERAWGQHEPVVRIVTRGYECRGSACQLVQGEGNGVIFAASVEGLWVLTAGHNVSSRDQRIDSLALIVQGNNYPARIAQTRTELQLDQELDFAVVFAPGNFSGLPVASLSAESLRENESVEFRGYDPVIAGERIVSWQYGGRATRLRKTARWYEVVPAATVQGNSGGGYFSGDGQLVALHSAKYHAGPQPLGRAVCSTEIRARLLHWGYLPASRASTPEAGAVNSPPPVAAPSSPALACNCPERMRHLEQNVNEALQRVQAQIDALSQQRLSPVKDEADRRQWEELAKQVAALQREVELLAPLKARRVILTHDGVVVKERVLEPHQPLVLGSEIVIRKPEHARTD